MFTRRLELKEQEVLLDLQVYRRRRGRVGGWSAAQHTHTHGRLMCALDLPSRRLAAMQGNLVPVTSVPLVYLTDHRPGCGLDMAKGSSSIVVEMNQHHQHPRLPA